MQAVQELALPLEERHGGVVTYTIELPYLPPSKNVYDNWPGQWKSAAKKKWLRDVAARCSELDVPKGQHRVGLGAVLWFPSRGRRDPQNYAQALWNWVPDALVRCGVLLDDAAGNIEIGPNWGLKLALDQRPTVALKARRHTTITLAIQERA